MEEAQQEPKTRGGILVSQNYLITCVCVCVCVCARVGVMLEKCVDDRRSDQEKDGFSRSSFQPPGFCKEK